MNFSQQKYFFPLDAVRPVTLIGAGSVGGKVANELARIGVTDLTVYDGDSVDSHNVPPSYCGVNDVGYFKVDVLARRLLRETGIKINTHVKHYEGEKLRGTVIACVDSMEARSLIWRNVKHNPLVDILIDTRTAQKFWQLFAIEPCKTEDVMRYEHYLYEDNEAAPQICGTHSISYVSSMIAAEAVQNLSEFWTHGKKNMHIERLCGSEIFIYPNSKESDDD